MNQRLLLWTIGIVGGIFLALTLLIVLNKAWRETRSRRHRARWWAVEPRILSWVHGEGRSILLAFPGGVGPADRPVVQDILLAHVQRVRGIARDRFRLALDQLGFVDDYLHELKSKRWWFRARAAERLGLAGSARATDRLVEALADEAVEVRIRAAKALGAVGGAKAVESLAAALEQPTRWSTLRIADILAEMGPGVVGGLVEQFPQMSPAAKLAVLDILARVRSLSVAPWLRERMSDPAADVRARAAHALGALGTTRRVPRCARHSTMPNGRCGPWRRRRWAGFATWTPSPSSASPSGTRSGGCGPTRRAPSATWGPPGSTPWCGCSRTRTPSPGSRRFSCSRNRASSTRRWTSWRGPTRASGARR